MYVLFVAIWVGYRLIMPFWQTWKIDSETVLGNKAPVIICKIKIILIKNWLLSAEWLLLQWGASAKVRCCDRCRCWASLEGSRCLMSLENVSLGTLMVDSKTSPWRFGGLIPSCSIWSFTSHLQVFLPQIDTEVQFLNHELLASQLLWNLPADMTNILLCYMKITVFTSQSGSFSGNDT